MDSIKQFAPINIVVHYPSTPEDQCQLALRVADVHADMVKQHIKSLKCPAEQKVKLLNAVIDSKE